MIDGINGGGPPRALPLRSAEPRAAATGSSDPASPLRRVSATAPVAGGRIGNQGLVKDLASAPPVDAAKVAQLREAIAAGRYEIDPDAIAGAMLALDRGTA